ncbi:heptaprenyl diphosphate synthase [Alkalibacterium subtropicum]|uniref:Heptaprenyl diphosphate synthase n=1 Tax=Alkalibacterium subtropicum TaxID=753702 RepID=A0A1I1L135_9LACT|nr:polyprenyl synthetase family protein [Alkalibacterium subtropicum]SFC66769.1 heptaprenyl diphosphate synthase [Alkalibacterium subtropicum]
MVNTHPMWDDYPTVQVPLQACLELIIEITTIENKDIEKTVTDLIESQGKSLRPAYFLLFSQLGTAPQDAYDNIIAAAASTEVLHLATLIHDDIIDEAALRRGSETVHSKHGQDVAVYTGDLMISVYFELLAEATDSVDIIQLNTQSMKRVLLGEINQMTNVYDTDITFEKYLQSIKGKTAQLFELSCYEGAYFGQCEPEIIEQSGAIGQNIGIAFQMLDDISDYTQTADSLKKPVLNDVQQGIYTLPLILGMERNKEAFLPLLHKGEDLSDSDLDALVALLHDHDCLERSHAIAKEYIDKALALIDSLPSQPEKDVLYTLTQTLLTRDY